MYINAFTKWPGTCIIDMLTRAEADEFRVAGVAVFHDESLYKTSPQLLPAQNSLYMRQDVSYLYTNKVVIWIHSEIQWETKGLK